MLLERNIVASENTDNFPRTGEGLQLTSKTFVFMDL